MPSLKRIHSIDIRSISIGCDRRPFKGLVTILSGVVG